MSIKKLLEYGTRELKKAGIKTAKLDAEILLIFALRKSRIHADKLQHVNQRGFTRINREWLYLNPNFLPRPWTLASYKKLIIRREKREPIAYLINHKEFYGLDFYVNKNVLIPRPETELLVEAVLQQINSKQLTTNRKKLTIVDIGTGSGCIAITLAKQLKQLKQFKHFNIYATDISKKALEVAKINAKKHKVLSKITFLKGNLLELLKEKNDIIVCNPPYVLKNEKTSPEVKYEPKIALFIKNENSFFEKLISEINEKLKNDGIAFMEIGNKQKKLIEKIAHKIMPRTKIEFAKDYFGIWRILKIQQTEF